MFKDSSLFVVGFLASIDLVHVPPQQSDHWAAKIFLAAFCSLFTQFSLKIIFRYIDKRRKNTSSN